MRRMITIVSMSAALLASASPAWGAIHEQVAAYCSGGGHGAINEDGFLEPPGVTGGSNADNFAQPVRSNGVVEIGDTGPVVTDHPAAKYPAGSSPFALPDPDHPSTHCEAQQP